MLIEFIGGLGRMRTLLDMLLWTFHSKFSIFFSIAQFTINCNYMSLMEFKFGI